MAMPRLLDQPRKVLGGVTAAVAALAGVFAYGQERSQLGLIVTLFLPVVILGLLARGRAGGRGWLYLAIAWVIGVLGAGMLLQ